MENRNHECNHRINHKYRDEMIVPLAAISNNVKFLFSTPPLLGTTGDEVAVEVVEVEEKHICTLEMDIKRLYGIPAWDFLKRWYVTYPNIDSMHFLKIKLRKL